MEIACRRRGDSQNVGNELSDRPCVRQTRLYRQHESGNAIKELMGQGQLLWDVDHCQGVWDGRPTTRPADSARPPKNTPQCAGKQKATQKTRAVKGPTEPPAPPVNRQLSFDESEDFAPRPAKSAAARKIPRPPAAEKPSTQPRQSLKPAAKVQKPDPIASSCRRQSNGRSPPTLPKSQSYVGLTCSRPLDDVAALKRAQVLEDVAAFTARPGQTLTLRGRSSDCWPDTDPPSRLAAPAPASAPRATADLKGRRGSNTTASSLRLPAPGLRRR
jgi:hypothetical protein